MENKTFQSGAVIDTRTEAQKLKDFKVQEVVASFNPVTWKEKTQSEWRKFPIFNQDGSGSCVAQTEAKELGIMRFLKDDQYVHFSATDIYQRRSNKPNSGMGAVDARSIASKGVTLEVLAPSQDMSDPQMDSAVIETYKREVGSIFSVPNYLELPVKDIDAIASMLQTTGKGVMVWFYFLIDEWTEHPVVKYQNLDLSAGSTARHSVTAVDFALVNGKKCLIIEDSWGTSFGMAGQRVIDEDFFKARNWYAGYLVNFRFEDQTQPLPTPPVKPKYTFNLDLQFEITHDDVKSLQDILRFEGMFPVNTQSTRYFGSITFKGVQQFQVKYWINSAGSPGYGRVGPITRSKLNQLYG